MDVATSHQPFLASKRFCMVFDHVQSYWSGFALVYYQPATFSKKKSGWNFHHISILMGKITWESLVPNINLLLRGQQLNINTSCEKFWFTFYRECDFLLWFCCSRLGTLMCWAQQKNSQVEQNFFFFWVKDSLPASKWMIAKGLGSAATQMGLLSLCKKM